jgi:hypothetical protein
MSERPIEAPFEAGDISGRRPPALTRQPKGVQILGSHRP